jgi:hypothetical protein
MPKLKNPELTIWNLFVEACGGKCCGSGCGKTDGLERGHLHRRVAGGECTLENLIPLCHNCNAGVKYGTKDTRPDGWRDRFVKLLAAELGLGFRVKAGGSASTEAGQPKLGSNGSQVTENTEPLNWQNVEFVPANVVWEASKQASQPKPLSDFEATTLTEEMVFAAKREKGLALPKGKRKEELVKIAKRLGYADFKLMLDQFVWMYDEDEFDPDPWFAVCEYESKYLQAAHARQANEAKSAAQQRQQAAANAKQQAIDDLKLEMITELRRLNDDWLANPENYTRRDDLIKRIRASMPGTPLMELHDELSALTLEQQQWLNEINAASSPDF